MPPERAAVPDPDPLERLLVGGGRVALASLFVLGGVAKIASPALYLEMMGAAGLEPARTLLTAVIALELGGGLWVAAGFRGHGIAAVALAGHTLLINLFLHPFWALSGAERIDEISFFFKNVSIAGGLLLVAGVERRRRRRRAAPEAATGAATGAATRAATGTSTRASEPATVRGATSDDGGHV